MGLKWRWWGRHGWPGRGDTGEKLNCVACSVRDSCSFFDPQLFRTGETTKRSRKCTLPAPPCKKKSSFSVSHLYDSASKNRWLWYLLLLVAWSNVWWPSPKVPPCNRPLVATIGITPMWLAPPDRWCQDKRSYEKHGQVGLLWLYWFNMM